MSMKKWQELSGKVYAKQAPRVQHPQILDLNIEPISFLEQIKAKKIQPIAFSGQQDGGFWNINSGSSETFTEEFSKDPTAVAYIGDKIDKDKFWQGHRAYLSPSATACQWKLDFIERSSSSQQVDFGLDPYSLGLWESKIYKSELRQAAFTHASVRNYFRLSGLAYAMAGATPIQQLATLLASLQQLKRDHGQDTSVADLFSKVSFELALDSHNLLSVAQIKALQMLLQRMCELEECQHHFDIFTVHSPRWLARREPWNNLLRLTSVTMAARMSGARGVVQLPYDCLLQAQAQRSSRNIDLILTRESHLGQVSDPLLGSPSLEILVESLCQRAWGLFAEIESKGGLLASVRAGWLQEEIVKSEEEQKNKFLFAETKMIGVNDYVLYQSLDPKMPLSDEKSVIDLETWWLNYQTTEENKIKNYDVKKISPKLMAEKYESWQFFTDKLRSQNPDSVKIGLWLEPSLKNSPRLVVAKNRLQNLGYELSESVKKAFAVVVLAAEPDGAFVTEHIQSIDSGSRPFLIWAGEKNMSGFDSYVGKNCDSSQLFNDLKKLYGRGM